MKNKSGKGSLGGIGCLVILAAGFFIMRACVNDTRSTLERLQNAQQTNEPSANSLAEPDPTVAELMFHKALRDYLNDPNSYTPGLLRHAAHPQGYAFIQEFRAKNAFGAMIKQSAGLLASTNSGTIAWTFYTPEQTSALIREILRFKAETDPKIKAFKESVDEAKRDLSANPVRDDPAVVESRKAKADRASAKPLPDIREEIAKRTREHAQNKLNPKNFTLLNLERRTHKLGTVWIQRFIADGKKWRTGFLESGGILSQIAPKTLQTYIDESTPEP